MLRRYDVKFYTSENERRHQSRRSGAIQQDVEAEDVSLFYRKAH